MIPKLFIVSTLLVASAAHADSVTYSVNETIGSNNAMGTITTDGHVGTLSQSDIVGFSLVLTHGATTVKSDATGSLALVGSDLVASAQGLLFNFTGNDDGYLNILANDTANKFSNSNYLCFTAGRLSCIGNGTNNAEINVANFVQTSATMVGFQQIATSATPEPSSIALLGTGVLGVIGVARRRLMTA